LGVRGRHYNIDSNRCPTRCGKTGHAVWREFHPRLRVGARSKYYVGRRKAYTRTFEFLTDELPREKEALANFGTLITLT
jgi:hypothetical protein